MTASVLLASRSPRRRELLCQLGVRFEVLDVEVVERRESSERPQDYVGRVARDKAMAGYEWMADRIGAVVLGADTEVVLDGEVFGKPADADQAAAMLRRLSGRVHHVISSVCCLAARATEQATSISSVEFADLDDAEIEAYVATGESFGKAGGYAIQGRAAAFIRRLDGSYSGVMGLPLYETARLLKRFGVV